MVRQSVAPTIYNEQLKQHIFRWLPELRSALNRISKEAEKLDPQWCRWFDAAIDRPVDVKGVATKARLALDLDERNREPFFTREELATLSEQLGDALKASSDALSAVADQLPSARTYLQLILEFRRAAQSRVAVCRTFEGFVERHTLGGLLQQLQTFYSGADAVAKGRAKLDAAPEVVTETGTVLWGRFLKPCEVLASVIDGELARGVSEIHAINRLRAYFQHMGRRSLNEKLQKSGARRKEAVIQEELDHFLFLEGLFPVTHSQASGGITDTFFENQLHQLEGELGPGIEPVLIELKQAWGGGDTKPVVARREVRERACQAIEQARVYQQHLSAHPRWASQRVYGVLVYDGPVRFRSDHADLVLIYVGDVPPSGHLEVLDVSPEFA